MNINQTHIDALKITIDELDETKRPKTFDRLADLHARLQSQIEQQEQKGDWIMNLISGMSKEVTYYEFTNGIITLCEGYATIRNKDKAEEILDILNGYTSGYLAEIQLEEKESLEKDVEDLRLMVMDLEYQLNAVAPSSWISVTERLPELNESVIVSSESMVLGTTAWINEDKYGNIFWEDSITDHLDHITHWQPLPQGPGKKEYSDKQPS